jgi:sulfur relay protein TusB/DsrH
LYALAADLAARGLAGARIRQGVQIVDDAGFVALAAVHRTSVSWA